jgi:hypothetical protein
VLEQAQIEYCGLMLGEGVLVIMIIITYLSI